MKRQTVQIEATPELARLLTAAVGVLVKIGEVAVKAAAPATAEMDALRKELKAVERDLDSRVDYALRQLAILDAPNGEHLERLEREKVVHEAVLNCLPGRGMRGYTTTVVAGLTGYPEPEVEQALHRLARGDDPFGGGEEVEPIYDDPTEPPSANPPPEWVRTAELPPPF